MDAPYLIGNAPPLEFPLSRYLPRLPGGLLSEYPPLREISAGSWLLLPFGESPGLALEAAALGYRVLVVTSNPVLAFLHRALTAPGKPVLWQNALARLAATRVLEHRLEPYVLAHYNTPCPSCGKTISARAFVWHKGAGTPHARLLACPHCGDHGLHRADPSDAARLPPLERSAPLHRARALQLVTPPGDALRPQAEAAIQTLRPRPLSVLFTLLNQAQQLDLPPALQLRLEALLLFACDHATTLWPHPEKAHQRPASLTTPPVYAEWNLWQALEEGVTCWQKAAHPLPCTTWPQLPPPQGGICLYPAKLHAAADDIAALHPAAVLAVLPRPNPAFWKQSILWSGWLWGRATIGVWHGMLRRYRYTWDWHTALLTEAWRALVPALSAKTPILALLAEDEPAFLRTALLSADLGGLHVQALALRPDAGAQIHAQPAETPPAAIPADLPSFLRTAARRHLSGCAEAAPGSLLQAAGWLALARARRLATLGDSPQGASRALKAATRAAFANLPADFQTFPPQASNPQTRLYWCASPLTALSLADRAEMALVQALIRHPVQSLTALERAACRALPGLSTPARDLLLAILASYARQGPQGEYSLREEDAPQKRRADLQEMVTLLGQLGHHLGVAIRTPKGENPWWCGICLRGRSSIFMSSPAHWWEKFCTLPKMTTSKPGLSCRVVVRPCCATNCNATRPCRRRQRKSRSSNTVTSAAWLPTPFCRSTTYANA